MYGDPDHPDRVTRQVHGPLYTPEDRALLAGLSAYEDSLCGGCSEPIAVAWHSEMDGWYDGDGFVCHACSAKAGHEVAYAIVRNTRPDSKGPMPPFVLGETTDKPTPPSKT